MLFPWKPLHGMGVKCCDVPSEDDGSPASEGHSI